MIKPVIAQLKRVPNIAMEACPPPQVVAATGLSQVGPLTPVKVIADQSLHLLSFLQMVSLHPNRDLVVGETVLILSVFKRQAKMWVTCF